MPEKRYWEKDDTARPSLPTKLFGRYNLGEMAVFFAIFSVLFGLLDVVSGLGISALPGASGRVVGWACFLSWLAFMGWLWTSLVIAGRVKRESRTSDSDLVAIQAYFFSSVLAHTISGPPRSSATWHEVSLVFEWIGVTLHVLYFLLALCIWVRVSPRTYGVFAIMLTLAIVQTLW